MLLKSYSQTGEMAQRVKRLAAHHEGLEFNPRDPYSGRGEPAPVCYPLTSIQVLCYVHRDVCMRIHRHIHSKQRHANLKSILFKSIFQLICAYDPTNKGFSV